MLLVGALGIAAVAPFSRSAPVRAALLLAVCALLAAGGASLRRATHAARADTLPFDEVAVLEGVLVDDAPSSAGGRRLALDVTGRVDAAQALDATVIVRLVGGAAASAARPGDRVRVRGIVRRLRPPNQPGDFDAERFGLARGQHGRLTVSDRAALAIVEPGARAAVFANARIALRDRLATLVTPREAGVVLALIVGDTASFDEEQHLIYRRVGAGHLLAVSGLQVSLAAVLLYRALLSLLLLVPAVGRRSRARAPAAVLALVGVWAFVALCGAPPSCVRAGAMVSAGLLAVLVGRWASGIDAFALAGLVTVLVDPVCVIDPSFLLSYAAVLGLLAGQRHPSPALSSKIGAVLLGSLASGLLTLPLSAHLFGEIAPGGLPANVVLVPVAAALQVPAIGLGLAGALLHSSALATLGASCAGALEAVTEALGAAMGGLVAVRAPDGLPTLLMMVAALLFVLSIVRGLRPALVTAAAALLLAGLVPPMLEPDGVRISVLPVGQGDGAFFAFPSGHTMLVDGGGVWDERVDPGERVVLPFLAREGIERIDVMVLSHPDPDHLLGLLPVLAQIEVGALWHSGHGREHPLMRRLLDAAERARVPVRVARALLGPHRFGTSTVTVLAPDPEDGGRIYPELSPNDNSLVLRIEHGEDVALWAGDIEEWGERYLLRDGVGRVRADVVKAPHHGSRTSSSPAFVRATRPSHVIFPAGLGNQWGFPHAPVVERWRDTGASLWGTASGGELTVWLTGDGVVVEAFRDGEVAPGRGR